MKKRYLLFSFILVAFVLTAQSTWAYFKDSREVKTAFSASVKSKGPYLEIANNGIFDPDHDRITLTVNYYKNSTLPWKQESVHLEIGTPYIFGSKQPLNNLFGVNNSGENSYYKISGLDKPVEITSEMATFNVMVEYSSDYSQSLQIRLGVEEIRFNLFGRAKSLQGESLDVQSIDNLLKIKTTPWNWPTSGIFKKNTAYKVTKYNEDKHTVLGYDKLESADQADYSELHTPVYYGPSVISRNGEKEAYSKTVFPSVRFITDNIDLFDNNNLAYSKQLERAKKHFPERVCYSDDMQYYLVRGPIYYIPGKGFIGLYYMAWYDPYNDYGTTNKVFKTLYIYKGEYKSIKYKGIDNNEYTYQLEPIDSYTAQYTGRFVERSSGDSSNPDVLKAKYQDYSNFTTDSSIRKEIHFTAGDPVYQGPGYVHDKLGSLTIGNHVSWGNVYYYWMYPMKLIDESRNEFFSR